MNEEYITMIKEWTLRHTVNSGEIRFRLYPTGQVQVWYTDNTEKTFSRKEARSVWKNFVAEGWFMSSSDAWEGVPMKEINYTKSQDLIRDYIHENDLMEARINPSKYYKEMWQEEVKEQYSNYALEA